TTTAPPRVTSSLRESGLIAWSASKRQAWVCLWRRLSVAFTMCNGLEKRRESHLVDVVDLRGGGPDRGRTLFDRPGPVLARPHARQPTSGRRVPQSRGRSVQEDSSFQEPG